MNSIALININNAQKIAYSSKFELFDGSIVFKRVSEFTITTVFSNITNQYGKIIDFTNIISLKNTEDYNYINVNGVLLKRAKIISFSLEEGNFNKNAIVTIVLQVIENGDDLSSLSGYYADYANGFLNACSFVENISESISISNSENSVSFSKEITIKFSNSLLLSGSDDPVVKQAQIFAKAIFDYDQTNGYNTIPDINSENLIRDILDKDFKKFNTERINVITNECSFAQSLNAENIKNESGLKYSHSATQSITIDQNGIVTVTENGSVKALDGFYSSQYNQAEQAYQNEIENARTRLDAIFLKYYKCQGADLTRQSGEVKFLSISKEIDKYRGIITYTVSATNDKKYENAGSGNPIFYSRTLSYDLSNNVWTATEKGTIEGMITRKYDGTKSGVQRYPKFSGAYTYYLSLSQSAILNRIRSFMQNYGCTDTISPNFISRVDNYSLLNGIVEYERVLSTDKKYIYNNQFKSFSLSFSKNSPFIKKNEFPIINNEIMIQPTVGNEMGSQNITVNLINYRISPSNSSSELSNMLNYSKQKASQVFDSQNNFIENASINYAYLNDVNTEFSIGYANGLNSP